MELKIKVFSLRGKNENNCQMYKNVKESREKRAKLLFFNVSYGKFVMLLSLLPSWCWLLKLPVFFICNCSGSRRTLLESYLHHIRAHNQLTHNQLKQLAPS